MLLRLPDDDRPLYRRIAAAVRGALVQGEVAPGERLPPGRELAQALGVNLDTVQRAYRLLAEDGLVTSRVGRGTRVVDAPPLSVLQLEEQVAHVVDRARAAGVTTEELVALVVRLAARA